MGVLSSLMGKRITKQVAEARRPSVEQESEDEEEEVKSYANFDWKEKGLYGLKWSFVLGFWYYFYTWAGSHSNQIDDEQVRYYLWFFDHAKTLGGLTMAILTLSESQSLLTGGRKR